MSKILKHKEKCIKCGTESEQLRVYSINYNLGKKEDNDKLKNHLQKCPNCGHESPLISKEWKNNLNVVIAFKNLKN